MNTETVIVNPDRFAELVLAEESQEHSFKVARKRAQKPLYPRAELVSDPVYAAQAAGFWLDFPRLEAIATQRRHAAILAEMCLPST